MIERKRGRIRNKKREFREREGKDQKTRLEKKEK